MGEPDWRRYLAAIKRRRWLVLAITLAGTATGSLVVSRFVEPHYLARARLWIGTAESGQSGRGAAAARAPDGLLGLGGWMELLRSHAVLNAVVRERRLYLKTDPPTDAWLLADLRITDDSRPGLYRFVPGKDGKGFTLFDGDGNQLQRGAPGDSVGATQGFLWVPRASTFEAGTEVAFEIVSLGDAADQLAAQLRVDVAPDATFLTVQLKETDAGQAAATVNAVAERVVAVAADLRRRKVAELSDILGEQVRHARATLTQAENALTSFRVRNTGMLPAASALAVPRVAGSVDLRVELDQLRRDRQGVQRALARAGDAGPTAGTLSSIGAVQQSPELSRALTELTEKQAELRALRYAYTDQSLPVQQLKDAVATLEQGTVPRLAGELIDQLGARERELAQRVDSTIGYLRTIPPVALSEARLEREVHIADRLFTAVQQRYDEARLAEISSLPDARILDRAVQSHRPASAVGSFVVIMSFVVSLGFGVVGAVLTDRADPRLHDPGRVSQGMGIKILGAVPHLSRHEDGNGASAQAVEALRTLRMRLEHVHGSDGPMLLAVTSPGVGEGKSLVAANLALAFAYAGLRTALVDGDVRRGKLHRLIGRPRRPGLTDYLSGATPMENVLQATTYPMLTFVGCGSRMHRGPELLGSNAMARLVGCLRERYDVVVVDTAPLAAGADPYAVAALTQNLLLVLRAGVTDLELAQAKLEAFSDLRIQVLGAVLNDVQATGPYRYYVYYAPGYETQEEKDAGPRKSLVGGPDV